jgi:hypothetical protein
MVNATELYKNAEKSILQKDEKFTEYVKSLEDEIVLASKAGKFQYIIPTSTIDAKIPRDNFSTDDVLNVFKCIYTGLHVSLHSSNNGFTTTTVISLSWDIKEKNEHR